MFQPATIEDARGQRIKFMVGLDSSYLKEVLRKDEYRSLKPVYEDDILGAWHSYFIFGSSWIVNLFGYLILFAFSVALFGIMMWTRTIRWFFVLAECSLGLGVIILGINRVLKNYRSICMDRPFPRMVLGIGSCPACLYSLNGHTAESDGCTVCPECGGAWRLPDESE